MKPVVDTEAARRADLARIHMGATALGMDTHDKDPASAYRAMLWGVARVRSASDLDFTGRKRVIDHLIKCGWQANQGTPRKAPHQAPKRPRRPTPAAEVAGLCRKVRAQLISLGKLPDSYADGIAQQMWQVTFYEWCEVEQLQAIVTALTKEQQRKGVEWKGVRGR